VLTTNNWPVQTNVVRRSSNVHVLNTFNAWLIIIYLLLIITPRLVFSGIISKPGASLLLRQVAIHDQEAPDVSTHLTAGKNFFEHSPGTEGVEFKWQFTPHCS